MARRDYSSEEIDLALAAFAMEGGRQKPTLKLLRAAGVKVPFATLRGWAYDVHKERYEQISLEVEKQVRTKMADQYHRLQQTSAELSEDLLARIKERLDKHDRELAATEARLQECEDEMGQIAAQIDEAQARLAAELEIPNVDALIERILGEEPDRAPEDLVVEVNDLYKRRSALAGESQKLWERRERLEVGFKDLAKLLHESGVMGGIATEKHAMLTGQATERVEHSFPELQRALEAKGIRLLVGQGNGNGLPPKKVPALEAGDG